MNKKLLKRIFPLIAVLLLAPWPVAYGHDVSGAETNQETVRIEVAEASAKPTMAVFGRYIGGVEAGDLFYIDATDNPADIQVIMHITNTSELIHNYRYLTLKIGIYVENSAGEWEKPTAGNGEPIPDTFITLRNGQVSFTLAGYAKYKVTIDSGSFYCITTNTDGGSLSPNFYLEMD